VFIVFEYDDSTREYTGRITEPATGYMVLIVSDLVFSLVSLEEDEWVVPVTLETLSKVCESVHSNKEFSGLSSAVVILTSVRRDRPHLPFSRLTMVAVPVLAKYAR
jgi:hypothetical protein